MYQLGIGAVVGKEEEVVVVGVGGRKRTIVVEGEASALGTGAGVSKVWEEEGWRAYGVGENVSAPGGRPNPDMVFGGREW